MLVYVIFALVIVVVLSWTMINQRVLRYSCGVIASAALIACTILLSLNFTSHYGMKKVTTVETHQVYSLAGNKVPAGVLAAKQLGTHSNRYVMVYRDSQNGQAKAHFVPNQKKIINAVKKHATYQLTDKQTATVTTRTTRWEWQNATAKRWLNVGSQAGELVKQTSTVYVPRKTWVVLTPTQMKKLKKIMATSQTAGGNAAAAAPQAKEQLAEAMVAKIKGMVK